LIGKTAKYRSLALVMGQQMAQEFIASGLERL
jgi:hypothetical protein